MVLFEIRIGKVEDDLCLSFFVMFARRSKSHSYSASLLRQPRGATTTDGDGWRRCAGGLGAPCSSFGLIAIYLGSTAIDTFALNRNVQLLVVKMLLLPSYLQKQSAERARLLSPRTPKTNPCVIPCSVNPGSMPANICDSARFDLRVYKYDRILRKVCEGEVVLSVKFFLSGFGNWVR